MNNLQPEPSVLNRALSPPHEVPEFTVTSYGVRARLPIIQIRDPDADTSIAVAVLACQGPEGSIVGLLLHQQAHPDDMPLYRIGVHCMYHDIGRPYPLYAAARYVRIHLPAHRKLSPSAATTGIGGPHARFALGWREVFLVYHAHSFGFADLRGAPTSAAASARPLLAPCRLLFPTWMLARLAARGFTPNRPLAGAHGAGVGPGPGVGLSTSEEFEVRFAHAASTHAFAFSVRFACCMRPAPVVPDVDVPASPRAPTSPHTPNHTPNHAPDHTHTPNRTHTPKHAYTHAHMPFRPLWAAVDASWASRRPDAHRDSPTAYGGVRAGIARRCVWCRETHVDYWPALEPEAERGGRTGRAMEFGFVGKTVRVTVCPWDARSRAHEAEGSGGGLYAVNIEVEDAPEEEGDGEEGRREMDDAESRRLSSSTNTGHGHGVREEGLERVARQAKRKSAETASRRSSSRPNSIRSLIAAVHRQVLGMKGRS